MSDPIVIGFEYEYECEYEYEYDKVSVRNPRDQDI